MKEHEGNETSFHNFTSRIYQFLRLNNEEVINLVFAKDLIRYLKDSRIKNEVMSGDIQPTYTEDMRTTHLKILNEFVRKSLPVEVPDKPLSTTLTAELLEAAYLTAFRVRPASTYTDLCHYIRINLSRFGVDQLPGTHSSPDMCIAMARCISWRYHYDDVSRQRLKSELFSHGDHCKYMYLPWALKWDGYSAGNLATQGFIWKILGSSNSEHEFVAQNLLFRMTDTWGVYLDAEGKVHARNATGQGHFNTFLHAMTVGAFPDIADKRYDIAPGLDILQSLVHASMDNGGGNIGGDLSFFKLLQQRCPQLDHPWDECHHLMSALKVVRDSFPAFGEVSDIIADMVTWVRTPKRWQQFRVLSAKGNHVWNDVQPVPKPRWAEHSLQQIQTVLQCLPAWINGLTCFLTDNTLWSSDESVSLAKIRGWLNKFSDCVFLCAAYFWCDILEIHTWMTKIGQGDHDLGTTHYLRANALSKVKELEDASKCVHLAVFLKSLQCETVAGDTEYRSPVGSLIGTPRTFAKLKALIVDKYSKVIEVQFPVINDHLCNFSVFEAQKWNWDQMGANPNFLCQHAKQIALRYPNFPRWTGEALESQLRDIQVR
jgi:hypothetical protein